LGEGENFGLSYQRGRRTNFFSISYADPWFMDTPNSLGISLYNQQQTPPRSFGYEVTGKGGTIAYGYDKSHYRTDVNEIPDANGNIPIGISQILDFTTSTIVPSYRYDSRDHPFDPTRGSRISLAVAYAGGPLGGTVEMLKPTVGLTRMFKLSRKTSLSFNAEAGYIKPFRDNCAYSYEELTKDITQLCVQDRDRFIVGGEFSVRGFQYGTLGPYEVFGGEPRPRGGYKYHVYNFEYI